MKFSRHGKTDKENGISYSGDEIMGLIERDNMALTPASFSPHSHTGLLLNRLMHGHDTKLHRTFKNRPNTNTCEDSARSSRVPHDTLGRANYVWRTSHPHEFYGGSYKSMDLRTHFDQSLGLVMSTAISSHLLRAHKRIRTARTVRTSLDDDTALTASASATTFAPIATEERPPPPQQVNTDDGTPDLCIPGDSQ